MDDVIELRRGSGADADAIRDESLVALQRAGAKVIITSWAKSYALAFKQRGGLDRG